MTIRCFVSKHLDAMALIFCRRFLNYIKCLMTFKTVLVQLRRVGTAMSMTYMKLMRYSYLIVWCKLVLCIGTYGYLDFEGTIAQC